VWRRLLNKELYDLYCPPNSSRELKSRRRWAWRVARIGDERGAYRVLVGMPEVKSPLGRHSPRWNDKIKVALQDVGWGGKDWVDLAGDGDR
jgi:hypothetical protein